jgi:RecA/RadA recombinase
MSDEEKTEGKGKKEKPRALASGEIKNLINKKTGSKNAYNMFDDDPTTIPGWISTSCRLLDSNICEGKRAGIPQARITMVASESGVGKSFLAIEVCKNAIDQGLDPVYFCSEPGGIETEFLLNVLGQERMKKFTYVEISFIEEMFETIEALMVNSENKYLFVWDSLAATPARAQTEGSFDPQSYHAIKANVIQLGLSKLAIPLSRRQCTFLILNQVRVNMGATKWDLMNPMTQFSIPGGKAVIFYSSLVILLFASVAKSNALLGADDERIGKYAKAVLKKSRFRTEGRSIPFGFTWAGGTPHIHNEELWGEALKERGIIRSSGPATYIKFKDGTEQRIKLDNWVEHLKDKEFYKKVDEILDDAFIINYDKSIIKDTTPFLEKMIENE